MAKLRQDTTFARGNFYDARNVVRPREFVIKNTKIFSREDPGDKNGVYLPQVPEKH